MAETKNELAKLDATLDTKKLGEFLDVMGLGNKLTQSEKQQFFEISIAFGLNPFKREIYCSKYGEQLAIIVGYETYIKRAERSGQLDGWQVVTEGKVEDNSLKAIITIHRKDRKIPFVHEVYYTEYVQKVEIKKDGRGTGQYTPNKFWQKAYTMTKKVAIAQGFRLCFSDELGGMPYTADELDVQDTSYEVVQDNKSEVKIHIEPTPDATKAVNDDITTEQVTKITTLLKSDHIAKANKEKISKEMAGYTSTRATSCITYLESEIAKKSNVQPENKQ